MSRRSFCFMTYFFLVDEPLGNKEKNAQRESVIDDLEKDQTKDKKEKKKRILTTEMSNSDN